MHNYQIVIHEICKSTLFCLLVFQVLYSKSMLWSALCETSGSGISHKRVIAFMTTLLFIHSCYYAVVYGKPVPTAILVSEVSIICIAATLASVPQIMSLVGVIMGKIAPPIEDKATDQPPGQQ